MARIVITGHKGTIGNVLVRHLDQHDITGLDLPEVDVTDYAQVSKAAPNHDVLIHLAWNQAENPWSGTIHPDNLAMSMNVYRAAIEHNIPKVILASSVHADNFYAHQPDDPLLHPERLGNPTSPYGASKHFVESLGRLLATLGPEVIAVRLGGVTKDNQPNHQLPGEADVWLSHQDLGNLFTTLVQAPVQPKRYTNLYAVSDYQHNKHHIDNPFGWHPIPDLAE